MTKGETEECSEEKTITQKEIDTGPVIVEVDLRAYRPLPDAAKTKEFEAVFFNRAVLLLDYMFVHRLGISKARTAIR